MDANAYERMQTYPNDADIDTDTGTEKDTETNTDTDRGTETILRVFVPRRVEEDFQNLFSKQGSGTNSAPVEWRCSLPSSSYSSASRSHFSSCIRSSASSLEHRTFSTSLSVYSLPQTGK